MLPVTLAAIRLLAEKQQRERDEMDRIIARSEGLGPEWSLDVTADEWVRDVPEVE